MSQDMSDQNETKPFIKLKSESGSETVYYSVLYEGLPEEFKVIAEEELNETKENKEEGLARLKEYSRRKSLPVITDDRLLSVLRVCKYNMKKSEAKLKNYLVRRREIKNLLAEIEPEGIENIIDDMTFGIFPHRDKKGRCILYTKPCNVNLERYDTCEIAVVAMAAVLMLLDHPISTIAGFTWFGECEAPFSLLYSFLKGVRTSLSYILGFPIRIGKLELLHENYLIRWFINIVSPILGKKIRDRISFHGDGLDRLHKMYDPEMLPEDFGGKLAPLSAELYREKLLDFIKDLKEENI